MQTSVVENLKNYEPVITRLKPFKIAALKRVLIVEDDRSLTHLIYQVLQNLSPSIEIDWATSGEQAEKYLQQEEMLFGACPYDLVVADIFLEGDITGLDIWKICDRKYPETNILVTSSLPVDQFVSCLKNEYACPPYLPKPFTMSECSEVLNAFL